LFVSYYNEGCGKTATVFDVGRHNFITYVVVPRQNDESLCSLDFWQLLNDINAIVTSNNSSICFNTEQDAITYILQKQKCEKLIKLYIIAFLVARRLTWSILHIKFDNQFDPLMWLYCQEDPKFNRFFLTVYEVVKKITSCDGTLLRRYYNNLANHFERITKDTTRFTIAIDECHRLQRYCRHAFLPRSVELLDDDDNLTEEGFEFFRRNSNIFSRKPQERKLNCPIESTLQRKSILPVMLQTLLKETNTVVVMGTNLELRDLREMDSMVAKYSENFTIEKITIFRSFTADDVVRLLQICLNKQGMSEKKILSIAENMEGKAYIFFIPFLTICILQLNIRWYYISRTSTVFDVLSRICCKST